MRMTPLEIQSQQFGRRWNGFDRDEVEAFMRMVSEDYQSLLKENESQRNRIANLESRLEELIRQENLLKETLLGARSMSEGMRVQAEKERNVIIGEAELRAEKIIDASHRRAARLAQDIREMRGLRTRLAESVRGSIETHLRLIEGLEADATDLDGNDLVDGIVEGKITYLSSSSVARSRTGEGEIQAELIEEEVVAVKAERQGGA